MEGLGGEMGLHTPWDPGQPPLSDLAMTPKVHGAGGKLEEGEAWDQGTSKAYECRVSCQCPATLGLESPGWRRIEGGQSILGIGKGSQRPAELGKGCSALFCPGSSQLLLGQCCCFAVSSQLVSPTGLGLPAPSCLPSHALFARKTCPVQAGSV